MRIVGFADEKAMLRFPISRIRASNADIVVNANAAGATVPSSIESNMVFIAPIARIFSDVSSTLD